MATQTGLFLASMVVVKKLILDPYLEVRQKREKATLGNEKDAQSILEQNQRSQKLIDDKTAQMVRDIGDHAQKVRKTSGETRQQLIAEAEEKAKAWLNESREQLHRDLEGEKARVAETIQGVSKAIFEQAIR